MIMERTDREATPTLDGTSDELRALPLLTDDVAAIPTWQPERREGWIRLLVVLLGVAFFLPNLGSFGLWDPWETHYGEVTRNMVETYDWVAPWWGFKEQIGTERINGDWFFSKPIYTFWAEATFVKLLGLSEFAIRLPGALLAIAAMFAVFLTFGRIVGRKAAFLAAIVVATSPQFFMIARQAQTDMPFVATMIVAMCFFILATFGPREKLTDRQFWWRVGGALAVILLSMIPQLLIIATDLTTEVAAELPAGQRLWMTIKGNGVWHVLLLYVPVTAIVVGAVLKPIVQRWRREKSFDDAFKDRQLRRFYMLSFYVFMAHSTLAKGLLGFLLPGFIIGVYLFLTRPGTALRLLLFFVFPPVTWPVLRSDPKYAEARRFEPILGFTLLLLVALPWYLAMFSKFGMAYYTRFFIHDHFNRLEAGVHQIDTGTFEHFVKWLGYGLFPWVVFVPFVVVQVVRSKLSDARTLPQLRLFLFLWSLLAYALFTLAATKFHHYIFPALPPLAILVAWFLWDSLRDRGRWVKVAALIAVGLHLVYAWDIHEEQQQLRNLMTYKYDRPLPSSLPIDADARVSSTSPQTWEDSPFFADTTALQRTLLTWDALRFDTFIKFVTVLGLVGLLLFFFVRTRGAGVIVSAVSAALLLFWSLNYYLPMLSPHWSQKYLFEAYYQDCTPLPNDDVVDEAYTPLVSRVGLGFVADALGARGKRVCQEDVISWLLTWRGETFYSYNEIQPINTEATQFDAYLRERNRGLPFYIFMERGKANTLQSKLNTYTKTLQEKKVPQFKDIDSWVVEVVHDENEYFILGKATPNRKAKAGASGG